MVEFFRLNRFGRIVQVRPILYPNQKEERNL